MNQPINTAILSFGMSGQLFHAPFIHVLEAYRFAAVLERTKNLAEQKYPGVSVYRSLDDLLSDASVELVIVNTPNSTHYEYAKKALQAGKHVVVEKPFTTTVEEAEELIALAGEKKLILSVYQNRRFDSDFRTVQKVVHEGWLGEIVEAAFHFDRYKPALSPKVHKEIPGPGTGALYDLGSHIIDQALQLFGSPEAVFADIRIVRPTSQVDDYFDVLLYYPSLRVRLHSSYFVREPLPGYILHGSRGSFIKARTDVQEASLQAGKVPGGAEWGIEPDNEKGYLHTENDGEVIKKHVPSLQGNYGDYFQQLYHTIRSNRKNPVPAEDGLAVIRIIQKAHESSVNRKILPL